MTDLSGEDTHAELIRMYRDEWAIREDEGGTKLAIRYPERTVPQVLVGATWEQLAEVLDAWQAGHK